ncbi:MAG TPA: enoyl-ACP reductase FabI [Candidatus Dormibacteraeota bacterium]|nr:enoyl-ACP reductase FabI [Candidatus Dormibacteraeota bacterium]
MLLSGKRILVTGVLTPASLPFAVARQAQEDGAEVILTSFGRAARLTERSAGRLSPRPEVLKLDVGQDSDFEELAATIGARGQRIDGIVHGVAFAPTDALGGSFLSTPWDSAATALRISAYSLKQLVVALEPLMPAEGGSVVTLDFDATQAWPGYDWMGVSKAALESVVRYLAQYLGRRGIRVNAVSAGPTYTTAAKGIPGFSRFPEVFAQQAPLGWDARDSSPVGKTVVALLSDYFPATTGELIHVDGGFHAVGASARGPEEPA